jgi:hypothetical protein
MTRVFASHDLKDLSIPHSVQSCSLMLFTIGLSMGYIAWSQSFNYEAGIKDQSQLTIQGTRRTDIFSGATCLSGNEVHNLSLFGLWFVNSS